MMKSILILSNLQQSASVSKRKKENDEKCVSHEGNCDDGTKCRQTSVMTTPLLKLTTEWCNQEPEADGERDYDDHDCIQQDY